MADKAFRIPFNRSYRLNSEYFKVRLELMGNDKFVEFIREEARAWEKNGDYDRNLKIAQKTYTALTGKELPAINDADVMAELKAENERLKMEASVVKEEPKAWDTENTNPIVDEVEPEVLPTEGTHSMAGLAPISKRGRGSSKRGS